MEEHDFEVTGGGYEAGHDELIEFAAEVDNNEEQLPQVTIDRVSKRFGYIIFKEFAYNYNEVFKVGLKHGLVVSGVYEPRSHDGEIGLYFKPFNKETVEREVVETIEEEQYLFDY